MKSKKILFASLALATVVAATLTFSSNARALLARKFYIGVSLPLSGPDQRSGELILNALNMAVDERNSAAGRLGRKLELIVKDDAEDPVLARRNAEAFCSDSRILAVIGHYNSDTGLDAAQVYNKAGVPVLSPSISDPKFMAASPWAFSINDSNNRQAEIIAAYLNKISRIRSVAVFNTDDSYGSHITGKFSEDARMAGLRTRVFTFSESQPLPGDFVARALKNFEPGTDAILIFAHSVKAAQIIQEVRGSGVRLPIFGGDRIATDLLSKLPAGTRDVRVFFPFMFDFASVKTADFVQRYTSRFDKTAPSVFSAFAYDGIGMIDQALRTKGHNRKSIQDFLANALTPATPYDGVSGKLQFGPDRAIDRNPVLGEIREGAFAPAFEQLRVASSPEAPEILKEKIAAGEMFSLNGKNFYKIQVVFAGVDYYRVNRVSPDEYQLEFFLWFKWRGDLDVENMAVINSDQNDTGKKVVMHKNFTPGRDWPSSKTRWISYQIQADFPERYDLRNFPFDTQRLPIEVVHLNKDANRLQLVADRVSEQAHGAIQEMPPAWNFLHREDYAGTFQYGSAFGNPDLGRNSADTEYSVYHTNLVVHRVLFPYLIRLFLPMGILIGVGLCILKMSVHEFEARCETLMGALLGILVEHMAQVDQLPEVSYLMKSDLLYIATYFMMFILVFENAWINHLVLRHQVQQAEDFDRRFSWVFLLAALAAYGSIVATALLGS
jgi:ABC-type branched-subunit amino acid transport system substrate-binding protein